MIIALLGRRDVPTDAVEDYSRLLGEAFSKLGSDFSLIRIAWDEEGWVKGLRGLWRKSAAWRGEWVLVQYTSLMWSRRGFPLLLPFVFGILRIRDVRIAVVFHDQGPFGGKRMVDRCRRACQRAVMRRAYTASENSILAIPVETASWLPSPPVKARYIPIGPNVPTAARPDRSIRNRNAARTITVFAITDAGDIGREVADIARAAREAAQHIPSLHLVTLGRGSKESEVRLRQALEGSRVEFRALGLLPADQVAAVLAASDVSLYVRGPITTQRGSAIASISNGVPLVTYANPKLPAPLAEAGIVRVALGDGEKLAAATVNVLTDEKLWLDLHERNLRAYEKYFSWRAVAKGFLDVLNRA